MISTVPLNPSTQRSWWLCPQPAGPLLDHKLKRMDHLKPRLQPRLNPHLRLYSQIRRVVKRKHLLGDQVPPQPNNDYANYECKGPRDTIKRSQIFKYIG